jgi:hypothetical protein
MRTRRGAEQAGAEATAEVQVDVLATAPAFAGCDRATLRRIADLGTEVERGPGAVLERAGRLLRQASVVLEGVAAERPVVGRQRAVSVGHLVGEAALRGRTAFAASDVVTETDVRLLVFGPIELVAVAELVASARRAAAAVPAALRHRAPAPEPVWALSGAVPSLA